MSTYQSGRCPRPGGAWQRAGPGEGCTPAPGHIYPGNSRYHHMAGPEPWHTPDSSYTPLWLCLLCILTCVLFLGCSGSYHMMDIAVLEKCLHRWSPAPQLPVSPVSPEESALQVGWDVKSWLCWWHQLYLSYKELWATCSHRIPSLIPTIMFPNVMAYCLAYNLNKLFNIYPLKYQIGIWHNIPIMVNYNKLSSPSRWSFKAVPPYAKCL